MTEPEVKLEIPAMTWEYRGEGLYICWSNRFHCGAKEDLAMFMWPFHAPEDTAAVECLYESIADFMVNAQRRLSAAEQENAKLREAAKALVDGMETCHECKGTVLVEDYPVHCEDCSSDCDCHDEPECPTIYGLHLAVKLVLKGQAQ
jgi:hypothetical protein